MRRKFPILAKRWGAAFAAAAVVATSLVTTGIVATPALAAPFACDSGSVYTQNSSGDVRKVDVSGSSPTISGTNHAKEQRGNGLGISADGNLAYTIDNASGTGGSKKQIAIYNGVTDYTETKLLEDPNVPDVIIRGAVNPKTGIYYYGGSGKDAYVGAYNPTTGIAIGRIGTLSFPGATSQTNGDFAFGANGELYVLAENIIYLVEATDVPTTYSATRTIPFTKVATLASGTAGNGIAFGANGKLFISHGTNISELDLTDTNPVKTTNLGFSHTDLASCSFPNTLTLKKNVGERYDAGDQFKLTVGDGSPGSDRSETTAGNELGLQDKYVGPLFVESGSTYSLSEAGAAGADLANYDSTLSCVNSAGASVTTSGSAPDWNLTFPTVNIGDNVVCTITNDAKERPAPGLELNKSANPASGTAVVAGEVITYTVTAKNTGNTVLDPVTIADDLSQVFAFGTYQNDVVTKIDNTPDTTNGAAITGDDLAWTGILQPDETLSITYSIIVNDGVEGETIENRVTASGIPPGPGEPIIPPSVTTEHPVAGFQIVKTANPVSGTVVEPGSTIVYTVTGTNTGSTLLSPATITDNLADVFAHSVYNDDVDASAGTALVTGDTLTWNGSLAAGDNVTVTYSVTVDEDSSGVVLKNVASGSATPRTPDPTNPNGPTIPGEPILPPQVSTEHPVIGSGFVITKSADPASGTSVNPGQTITYTVTGTNTGDSILDPASISDDLVAVLSGARYNEDVATSSGTVAVTGDVLTWDGTLGAGQTVTITYSATVNSDAAGMLIENVATGEATPLIPIDPTDPDSPTTPADPIIPSPVTTEHPVNTPGFEIGKSADPAAGTAVDPGSVITYTVTGVNSGETSLNTVDIADDMSQVLANGIYNDDATASTGGDVLLVGTDLTWTGSLAVGETVTITYSVTVNADAGGELLKNTVNATATPPGGEEITPPPVTTENPVNLPGFSLSKASDPAPGTMIDPGSVITYTVTGVNTGETALKTVDIADDMTDVLAHAVYNDDAVASIGGADAGNVDITGTDLTWTGALAVGETVTVTYSVTINGDAGGEVLNNTVNATATPPGGEEITPPPPTIEHPVNLPGFEIAKAVSPATGTAVDPGSILTYTITGVNTGETALNIVDIADDMSQVLAHAKYNNDAVASIGGTDTGDVLVSGADLTWTGSLAVGETVTITYSVTVNGDAGEALLKNTVNATATPRGGEEITPPPATTENPVNSPGFEITKSANPKSGSYVAEGSTVVYTLTGVNTGQTELNTVTISDNLTEVLKYSSYKNDVVAKVGDRTVKAPVVAQNQLIWTGNLAVGETITITYSVKVNDDANGKTLKNVAVASATPPGGEEITPPPSTTEHHVKTALAVTGAQAMPWLVLLGAGLVSGGGALLVMRRRQTVN